MLWYSLEAPHRGASNEYPQQIFCGEIRNISTFLVDRSTLSGAMELTGLNWYCDASIDVRFLLACHIWVDSLQSSHSIQFQNFLTIVVHMITIYQCYQTAH